MAAIAVFLFLGGALAIQRWILAQAVRASVSAMKEIDSRLPPESSTDPEEDIFFPLFPFGHGVEASPDPASAEEPNPEAAVSPGAKRVATSKARRGGVAAAKVPWVPPVGPTPQSTRATAETVLGWANSQLVPRGRTVSASFGLPAGIELFGAGALGLGVLDGDRLVAVDGVPVTDRGEVVSIVLAARLHERKEVVASLARRTESGVELYSVVLEQPYLSEEELLRLEQGQSSTVSDP